MKLLFALAICLLVLTSWVMSLDSYVAVPCNGQEVIAVAELAVDHINKDRKQGYKFSVDRLENAQEMTEASGKTVYYLDIDIRETKCHVLSHKLLKDCEIRSFKETKVEGDCKVIVEAIPGAPSHVKAYKCEISPDSAEDVSEKCPDCPHLIHANTSEAQHAVTVSLNKYNQISNHVHTFALKEITRASTKGPGTRVLVEYVIRETPCVKGSAACALILLVSPDLGFCSASVTPSTPDEEIVDVVCELYSTKVAEGNGTAPPVPEGEVHAPPVPEGEVHAPPVPEGEVHAPPVPEGEGCIEPAPEGEGSVTVPPKVAEAHIVTPAAQEVERITPILETPESILPKRKRSVDKESSESSEEHIASTGIQTIHFPDLPADPTTCPAHHKYPEDQ